MATTSLWHIKGRLKDLIDYVENPEKTASKMPELQDLYNVFSYVQRPEATQEGDYVTALNCLKETALRQMILTKKRYGKTDGYIAWHGYQSFKPEEVTPQLAHEIGVKLAKEMWGDRFEIIVTTHLDKEHIHCHFCFNSVSFRDGGKCNYSKTEQLRLREASDRLCREYGLSVIEKPHKAPSRPVWLDEKNGKPTRYNVYRADVQEAIDFSRTPYYMEDYLRRKGYITDFTGKHWRIRLPQYEHFTRLDTLDERWTPENIRLGRYASFGNRRAYISYPPQMPQELSDWFRPFHKTSHIYKLYLHYCYLLGYLPKHTDYKPTSPYLKEDLRKLDELSQQVRYMGKYGIDHGAESSDPGADPRVRGRNRGVCAQIPRRQAGAAFGHLLQRRGHSPRADPGGDGRSLPAAPRPAQQRENGVTTRVTPFPRTYKTVIQEPPRGTFLTEGAPSRPPFFAQGRGPSESGGVLTSGYRGA